MVSVVVICIILHVVEAFLKNDSSSLFAVIASINCISIGLRFSLQQVQMKKVWTRFSTGCKQMLDLNDSKTEIACQCVKLISMSQKSYHCTPIPHYHSKIHKACD